MNENRTKKYRMRLSDGFYGHDNKIRAPKKTQSWREFEFQPFDFLDLMSTKEALKSI